MQHWILILSFNGLALGKYRIGIYRIFMELVNKMECNGCPCKLWWKHGLVRFPDPIQRGLRWRKKESRRQRVRQTQYIKEWTGNYSDAVLQGHQAWKEEPGELRQEDFHVIEVLVIKSWVLWIQLKDGYWLCQTPEQKFLFTYLGRQR